MLVHSNPPPTQTVTSTPRLEDKEQQMRKELSELNDVDIIFYGRLEDQFGHAVGNSLIKFEVPFNNGNSVGVHRGTIVADGTGCFTISGYKGKSLSVVPLKTGYALASLTGGGIYSYLWPESQRAHPDPNNPVVIKMWKLQGAEPLASIDKEYTIPYTDRPLFFDLIAGRIVPAAGDIKLTVNRPEGEVSEHNRQEWSIDLEAIGGGLIEFPDKEWVVSYAAPENGYQPRGTFKNNSGPNSLILGLFVKSRNGQVYSKLGLSIRINNLPDGLMYIKFGGVANTNWSRNWEGDPNTLKAAGQ
jgi:hypothetical protein